MRTWILIGAASLLAACNSSSDTQAVPPVDSLEADTGYYEEKVVVTGSRVQQDTFSSSSAPASSGGNANDTDEAIPRQLAYEYDASLRLPAASVGAVLSSHEARCQAAGPRICQVISSSVTEQNADYVYGSLQIRATREFMDEFRNGLSSDAEKADGQLVSMNARAEDLTRQITDTTARLEAQKTLRDRLLLLLERETDNVGDLLQIERELARVQTEIESAESWLRTLRARVSMDRLTLNYQSIPKAVTPHTAQPLRDAFTSFFSDVAWSLAAVIGFIATLLPWLIIIIPGLLLLRSVWRNWRKK